jgi:hypothetical protein
VWTSLLLLGEKSPSACVRWSREPRPSQSLLAADRSAAAIDLRRPASNYLGIWSPPPAAPRKQYYRSGNFVDFGERTSILIGFLLLLASPRSRTTRTSLLSPSPSRNPIRFRYKRGEARPVGWAFSLHSAHLLIPFVRFLKKAGPNNK